MSDRVTRMTAAAPGRTRYIINCVISALFRGDAVLLVSLNPDTDPYSAEIRGLGGRHHHPDYEIVPVDRGSVGANLVYVCWAPASRSVKPVAADYASLMNQLRPGAKDMAEATARLGSPLVIIDGCQHLGDVPVANHAAELRDFVRSCIAAGLRVIVAGEDDWNTEWLERCEETISPLLYQAPTEDHWQTASQQLSSLTGRY